MTAAQPKGKKNNMQLLQMSYLCPGLHGPDSRQHIVRKTFGDFLLREFEHKRLIIPLFQRRYCWDQRLFQGWWSDTVSGKRDHLGIHNSGNCIGATSPHPSDNGNWIVIDGQQRTTTTSLFVAAIRDAVIQEGGLPDVEAMLNKALFFTDTKSIDSMKKQLSQGKRKVPLEEGEDFPEARLVPSFSDRRAYFSLIVDGFLSEEAKKKINEDGTIKGSYQWEAKRFFDTMIQSLLNSRVKPSPDQTAKRLEELKELAFMALEKMGITLVDIRNEINMAQVFLWLQEKSLFGESAILFNPSPGIDFTPADLARNLILASVMDRGIKDQEQYYRKHWLMPIERKFKDVKELSLAIKSYIEEQQELEQRANPKGKRHVSALEAQINQICSMLKQNPNVVRMANIHGQFYSIYEKKMMKREEGTMAPPPPPPSSNDRKDQPKTPETKTYSEECIRGASDEILKELTDYVAKYAQKGTKN